MEFIEKYTCPYCETVNEYDTFTDSPFAFICINCGKTVPILWTKEEDTEDNSYKDFFSKTNDESYENTDLDDTSAEFCADEDDEDSEEIDEETLKLYTKMQVLHDSIFPWQIKGDVFVCYNGNSEEIVIPDTVKIIGESAFWGLDKAFNTRKIVIPPSVCKIEDSAFMNCFFLEDIVIPETVSEIGSSVFNGCISLEEIKLPISLKNIKHCTFHKCQKLKSIDIPNKVTTIGDGAFFGCKSLESISLPAGLQTIGKAAFANCTSLTEIVIPDSVESIDCDAFCNCTSLVNVTLPEKFIDEESIADIFENTPYLENFIDENPV